MYSYYYDATRGNVQDTYDDNFLEILYVNAYIVVYQEKRIVIGT